MGMVEKAFGAKCEANAKMRRGASQEYQDIGLHCPSNSPSEVILLLDLFPWHSVSRGPGTFLILEESLKLGPRRGRTVHLSDFLGVGAETACSLVTSRLHRA